MRDWIENILNRYGQSVSLETAAGRTEERAFLQPVTERGERTPDGAGSLGWTDGRLWLYLGRTPVEAGDTIAWGERTFRARSGRPYAIGDETLYYWASLEREREAAE